jgi:hypothetical protein
VNEAWPCGHPKTPENTQAINRGKRGKEQRICRKCRRDYARQWMRERATALKGDGLNLPERHALIRQLSVELAQARREMREAIFREAGVPLDSSEQGVSLGESQGRGD